MSHATASAAAASSTCNLYEPVSHDVLCAVPYKKDYIKYMDKCCPGQVYSYGGDKCGLYCLALGTTVGDLTDCLHNGGKDVAWQDVFCSNNKTSKATATGDDKPPATASVTVVGNKDGSSKSGKTADSTASSDSSSATSTDGSSKKSDKKSGGVATKPQTGVTTVGMAIGALLFTATAFGAFSL